MRGEEILFHVVNSKHGWSVSEQFKETFSGEKPFEEMNGNALRMILRTMKEISSGEVFNETEFGMEMFGYMTNLEEYLSEFKK